MARELLLEYVNQQYTLQHIQKCTIILHVPYNAEMKLKLCIKNLRTVHTKYGESSYTMSLVPVLQLGTVPTQSTLIFTVYTADLCIYQQFI
jgi:hypothetical protein